ncbi:hypothetical protein DM02DRAFT_219170 [Periconia macrospinosa]|uniref:Uncharacterized protein n=1 Tax=Periconia macrospinosa TaxID=97972 RepID=A0A2V1E072_9PLEO|nr:hypothetical protein DM02DRAFT_219170 [Periconia macrospinosa]
MSVHIYLLTILLGQDSRLQHPFSPTQLLQHVSHLPKQTPQPRSLPSHDSVHAYATHHPTRPLPLPFDTSPTPGQGPKAGRKAEKNKPTPARPRTPASLRLRETDKT